MKKLLVISGLSIALSGCFSNTQEHIPRPIYVDSYTVHEEVSISERTFQGTTIPADMTPLAFRYSGKLKRLEIKSGDEVKKGDVLAVLETTKLKQQIKDAKAQLALATAQYKRAETLQSRGMISESEYDELKANQKLLDVHYKVLNQELKHSKILAPFDGVIATIEAESFQNVSSAEQVLSIYKDKTIHVDIPVSEEFIHQIKLQQNPYEVMAEVRFASLNKNYQAKLKLFSAEQVTELKGYLARFELVETSSRILPGTAALVAIDVEQFEASTHTALLVPLKLLVAQSEPSEFSVWKVDSEGNAELTPVSVSSVTAKGALIAQGVDSGDQLIASQLSKLTQGKAIQFVDGNQ
ncbi:efflux RND transporter periplasmic adaptor subunit [Vibrio superstes]|uniref:Membrane protein n=1 Tax=Vibrio superstes NBRC 103154 TaxID=1219062 RepID=A0A511QSF5_9VIBR|nr:efflux RND transporter periplasmic adaptor subunit [Vibrio superstes]GEM80284.1 membrane protein [Vibrio superstes NBRC 103154]